MKNTLVRGCLPAISIVLSGLALAAKDPPPYEGYVENIAPATELAVITSLGGAQPQSLRFAALENSTLDFAADDMIVNPGCRCTCVVADLPPVSAPAVILVPMCIDAQPGHTYIVSVQWGLINAKIWINEWPTSEVSGKLFHWDYNYTNVRLFNKKKALLVYKYSPGGEFVSTKKAPAPEFCAVTGPICEPPSVDAELESE